MDVQNKRVLVVGLARSGLAMAYALVRRGAVVMVSDRKPPAEFRDVLPQLLKEKVGLELGSQSTETFLRHEVIVISPGVPWDLPQLVAARERGIPVYPEVEAAAWFLEGTMVGITGSNGKTTTTTLLGDMLKASGFPTFVGGNIGNALSSAVDHARPGTRFVTELSSFQLEGIHDFHPHVAVMLNLSPNHLDRHPSLEAYAQAKRQIFRNQQEEDFAVLNADDPWVAGLEESVASQPVFFSRRRELPNGVFVAEGRIYYRVRHLERVLFDVGDVRLRGEFNLEDVLAATTAACMLGADFGAIRRAVRAFQAVEHRLEFVSEIQGVEFYNNSKATSVDATMKSLEAFPRGVHLILGGKDKGAPYAPLRPLIKERVREILLIGAAAPVIAEQLAGSTELIWAGDLETAVRQAFAVSRPGDIVLLAPACSSFDQFKDYEERGRVFKEIVKRLAAEASVGAVMRKPTESAIRNQEFGIAEKRRQESGVTRRETGDRSPGSGVGEKTAREPEPKPAPPAVPEKDTLLDRAAEPALGATKHTVESGRVSYRLGPDRPEAAVVAATPEPSVRSELGSPAAAASGCDRPESAAPAAAPPSPEGLEAAKPAAALQAIDRPAAAAPAAVPQGSEGRQADSPVAAARDPDQPVTCTPADVPQDSEPDKGGSPVAALPDASRISSERAEPPALGIPGADSLVEKPQPPEPETKPATPHRLELSYVYEVDAVEVPEVESQVVPEDEPSIPISADPAENLDDEKLPYEARKGKSEVRGPKSEIQSRKSEVRPSSAQPRLFEDSDK